jgi:diguanylate cyclase (GGDEF)-like protein/PAS domain S-box-containing protein
MSINRNPLRSLKTRLTLWTLAIFLLSIWSLTFYAEGILRTDMQRVLTEQQFATVSFMADDINQRFEERVRALVKVASRVESASLADPKALQTLLEQQPQLLNLFNAGVLALDFDGTVVADFPRSAGRMGINLMGQDTVAAALKEGSFLFGKPVMSGTPPAPVFGMAVPIRDADNHVVGAIYGETTLGAPNFLDKITDQRYGKSGHYFVASLDHRLNVTSSDKSRVMQRLPRAGINPYVDRFVQGYEGSANYVDQYGTDILVSVKRIPIANWAMVATLPSQEAFAPIRALQKRMLLASTVLTLLAGAVTWWMTWMMLRRQLSPMLAATRTLANYSHSRQALQPLAITSQDEIGELIGGFNQLLAILGQREQQLRESHERFDLAVRGSSDGIWDWDLVAGTGYVSDRWWMLLGYQPGEREISPDGWMALIHPDDSEKVQEAIRQHLTSNVPFSVEFRMQTKSGVYRWFLTRGEARRNEQGKAIRMAGSATDITEVKQAQEELRRSEAYNKVLFSGSHIPLVVLDSDTGRMVDCNQAAVNIYRKGQREAVLGLTPLDVSTPLQYDGRSSAEAAQEHIQAAMREGSHLFEWRHQRPNGEIWDAEVHLMAFQNGDKTLLQFSLQDITARKRSEADLRVAAVAFDSQEGMIITDGDLKILRINRACCEITGYLAHEAIGQTPRMFSSGRHNTAFYQAMWSSINTIGSWEGELWNRRKNGEVYPEWATISAVKANDGTVSNYVASFIDISSRKTAEAEIKHLAFYDPLTRLPNRRLLLDRLRHALQACSRSDSAGALFFIDVDNFKTLNDTLGHDKGDLLLESVARRLSAAVREEDTVARLGGDEFVIMMEGLSLNALEAAAQARVVAEKILAAFEEKHDLLGLDYLCTASIGIAMFTHATDSVEELLKHADLSMYQAKAAGRNTLRFFDPKMQSVVMARTEMEADLRLGLREQQLLLHYQPQVDDDGRMSGAEALVRWMHPVRGMVSPAEFIPLAEETGLITNLGHWVLQTACLQLVAWAARAEMSHLTIAVNVSAQQFRQADFVEQVLAVLRETGVNPHRLKLELTESLLVDNVEEVIGKMYALKAKGVGFSLDDFGTGYSSLSYLKRLPLDQLKIDQSFVRDIHVDANDAAIAKTIVTLAHSLGLGVISEGVETAAQRDFLAQSGCHAHQGYFFSRPLPIDKFEAYASEKLGVSGKNPSSGR